MPGVQQYDEASRPGSFRTSIRIRMDSGKGPCFGVEGFMLGEGVSGEGWGEGGRDGLWRRVVRGTKMMG